MNKKVFVLSGLTVALLMLTVLAPIAVLADPGCYVVRCGDTLSAIGRRYGVSAFSIAAANGIANPNLIYPGQCLRIPGAGVPYAAPQRWAPAPRPAPVVMPHVPQWQAPAPVQTGAWVWVGKTYYGPGSGSWAPAPVKVWWPYSSPLWPVISQVWGAPTGGWAGSQGPQFHQTAHH